MTPRRFCWRCGRRVNSSKWRNCPSELISARPKSPKEGTTPIICYLGDCYKAYIANIAKKEPIISKYDPMPMPVHHSYSPKTPSKTDCHGTSYIVPICQRSGVAFLCVQAACIDPLHLAPPLTRLPPSRHPHTPVMQLGMPPSPMAPFVDGPAPRSTS